MRLKVLVSLAVGVAAVFTVPALGTDPGLVHLAGWGSEDEVSSYVESIAATADGSIVVADRKRDRVVRFTYGHALAGSFAATDPRGIAAIPGGGYLVSEAGRVRRTDVDGTTLATYDADDPYGVALTGDVVLIADADNGRILRYRLDGSALPAWKAGLVAPRGLAVGPDGTVYVADAGRWRIETFSADGEDTGGWWVPDPHGAAVDANGTVYVATDDFGKLNWFGAGLVRRRPPRLDESARRRRRLPRHGDGVGRLVVTGCRPSATRPRRRRRARRRRHRHHRDPHRRLHFRLRRRSSSPSWAPRRRWCRSPARCSSATARSAGS